MPVQAIHRTGRQTVVYVSRDGVFESRPVDIGRTSELYAEITSGLVAGELVLLTDPPVGTVVEQEDKTEL